MNSVLSAVVGGLYAVGLYMMMGRSIVKLILGLALLSHAANLLIFVAAGGGMSRLEPPIVRPGAAVLSGAAADPVPQALILTAIVISFGVQAFAVVLVRRATEAAGTDDLDRMTGRLE